MSQETSVLHDEMAKLKAWNKKYAIQWPSCKSNLFNSMASSQCFGFHQVGDDIIKVSHRDCPFNGVSNCWKNKYFCLSCGKSFFTQRIDYYWKFAHVKKDKMMLLKTKVESVPQSMQMKSATMIQGTAGLMNLTINKSMNNPSVSSNHLIMNALWNSMSNLSIVRWLKNLIKWRFIWQSSNWSTIFLS